MGFVSFGPNTKVLHGAVDLSTYFREASVPMEVDVEEATTCGKTAKVYKPTLIDGSATLAGLYDGAEDAVDEMLAGALGADASPVTIAWEGLTIGKRVTILDALETSYEVSGGVGGLVEVSAEFQADEGARSGVALHALTAETTSGSATSVDNGASSAGGGFAVLHFTLSSSPPNAILTVKVQHSTDNSAWADLITFAASAVATSERAAVAGTVNRYLRASWTTSSPGVALTFAAAFART